MTARDDHHRVQDGIRQSPEPPEPPGGPRPEPEQQALVATQPGAQLLAPTGMPGQREGRPTSLPEAALQVTLKWMDHMSDAAELALGDPELAEAHAQSIATFYLNMHEALRPYFPARDEDRR